MARLTAIIVVLFGLGGPGFLPALAAAGRSPVLLFLAPLTGAIMAALAAEIELGVGGSLLACFILVAVLVNLAVIAWWVAARRARSGTVPMRPDQPAPRPAWRRLQPWGWYALTVATLLGAMAVPLTGLGGNLIGWDSNSIWLTHALMIFGGHHELLTGLQNHTYQFSNPDYPPLVPAVGALAFTLFGVGDLRIAVETTAFVTACGLGAAATAVAAVADAARQPIRLLAVAAAGALCLAGFAAGGRYSIDGRADLAWAAAAVAAIVWGLVLPRSRRALVIAWICAMAASLTKNEGLATALIVLVLIALRYRPLRRQDWRGPWPDAATSWAWRGAFVLVPALPGLAWAGIVRLLGLHDAFFATRSAETLGSRAVATVAGMAAPLMIVPVALVVLLAGCWLLRGQRTDARLANPAWLWLAWIGSLAIIFCTYVFGSLGIQLWLKTSVSRTTIFAQVLIYTDLAIWLILGVAGAIGQDTVRPEASALSASAPGDQTTPATSGQPGRAPAALSG